MRGVSGSCGINWCDWVRCRHRGIGVGKMDEQYSRTFLFIFYVYLKFQIRQKWSLCLRQLREWGVCLNFSRIAKLVPVFISD